MQPFPPADQSNSDTRSPLKDSRHGHLLLPFLQNQPHLFPHLASLPTCTHVGNLINRYTEISGEYRNLHSNQLPRLLFSSSSFPLYRPVSVMSVYFTYPVRSPLEGSTFIDVSWHSSYSLLAVAAERRSPDHGMVFLCHDEVPLQLIIFCVHMIIIIFNKV